MKNLFGGLLIVSGWLAAMASCGEAAIYLDEATEYVLRTCLVLYMGASHYIARIILQ